MSTIRCDVRCVNCERDRLPQDVFWHARNKAMYCTDVFGCQRRYTIQVQRSVIDPDDPRRSKAGQDRT